MRSLTGPFPTPRILFGVRLLLVVSSWGLLTLTSLLAQAHSLTLDELVSPSSIFRKEGEIVPFALHGFIEFQSLAELFDYIDTEAGRWRFASAPEQRAFADDLLHRGTESRIVSMTHETPLEILLTHTTEELVQAVNRIRTQDASLIFEGKNWTLDSETYRDVLVQLRQRWKSALNCWSASSSIAGRVLSNWYVIQEGIPLFGATYDSTEHFWQAVKYHPEVTLEDVADLLERIRSLSWGEWLEQLHNDQEIYLKHGYAVEFLRHNLSRERLEWFQSQVAHYTPRFRLPVRKLQQRDSAVPWTLRFTPFQEKVLWGDLADVFHLLYYFAHLEGGRLQTAELKSVLGALSRHHFDAIYLSGYGDGQVPFISSEFQQLMLEIWKVKFLQMERFREVLLSTQGRRLLHFLNDGDSPDIPIPIYVGYLEEIRRLALR